MTLIIRFSVSILFFCFVAAFVWFKEKTHSNFKHFLVDLVLNTTIVQFKFRRKRNIHNANSEPAQKRPTQDFCATSSGVKYLRKLCVVKQRHPCLGEAQIPNGSLKRFSCYGVKWKTWHKKHEKKKTRQICEKC